MMKPLNKKRIERLEKFINPKKNTLNYAMVIFDPSIDDFDISVLDIKTDVVFALPDNGRRVPGDEIPKGSYKITYG